MVSVFYKEFEDDISSTWLKHDVFDLNSISIKKQSWPGKNMLEGILPNDGLLRVKLRINLFVRCVFPRCDGHALSGGD